MTEESAECMKKMIFGLTLMIIGCLCSAIIIASTVLSPLNPRSYNGIDIVNIGSHFFLKNVRPYAASCSEA